MVVVDAAVVGAVRRYMDVLRREHALNVRQAVLFGSYARGEADLLRNNADFLDNRPLSPLFLV